MVQVNLPRHFSSLTGGEYAFSVSASSVNEVISELKVRHPLIIPQILDKSGELRQFISIFVNDQHVLDLKESNFNISDGSTVSIIIAVAGG
jgi:molybdopterin synthase sulfur carrier subunit